VLTPDAGAARENPRTQVKTGRVRDKTANPYWFDESDQEHCAICFEPIVQPRRGPVRVYCIRSACRRTGAINHRLAEAWDEGYTAGSRGGPVVALSPPPKRSRWSTAFEAGAEEAKRQVGVKFKVLTASLDWYLRNRTAEKPDCAQAGCDQDERVASSRRTDRWRTLRPWSAVLTGSNQHGCPQGLAHPSAPNHDRRRWRPATQPSGWVPGDAEPSPMDGGA